MGPGIPSAVLGLGRLLGGGGAGNIWQRRWMDTAYSPKWLNRGISPEIGQAVRTGWLPRGVSVLDLGCGEGDVTAWMLERGYRAEGVDVATAASDRAYRKHPHVPPGTFYVADLTSQSLPRKFSVFIDRGCFHCIGKARRKSYVSNIISMAEPEARMLLFIKAFRRADLDPDREYTQKLSLVEEAFSRGFWVEKHARTDLGLPESKAEGGNSLPGLVFWIRAGARQF